jgi:hypothetical protein
LQLLTIDLDQRLAGLDRIAQIRQDAPDDAFGLRGNGDFIGGGERADDFDRAVDGLLPDGFGFHELRRRLTAAILVDLGSSAACRQRDRERQQENATDRLEHKCLILLGMTRRWNVLDRL